MMSYYSSAKDYILANWFDGAENADAVVSGDEETMAMKAAVEALEIVDGDRDMPIGGYSMNDLILFAVTCRKCGIHPRELHNFHEAVSIAIEAAQKEINETIQRTLETICWGEDSSKGDKQ